MVGTNRPLGSHLLPIDSQMRADDDLGASEGAIGHWSPCHRPSDLAMATVTRFHKPLADHSSPRRPEEVVNRVV